MKAPFVLLAALAAMLPLPTLAFSGGPDTGLHGNRLSLGEMRDLERQTVAQVLGFQDESTVVVRDLNDREVRAIQIDGSIRLRAQSRKEFDGRRNLTIADLQPGRVLRITLSHPFGEVRKVRILRHGKVPKTHFRPATRIDKAPNLLPEPFPRKADD